MKFTIWAKSLIFYHFSTPGGETRAVRLASPRAYSAFTLTLFEKYAAAAAAAAAA